MSKRRPTLTRNTIHSIANTKVRDIVDEALRLGWTGIVLGSGHLRLRPPLGTGDEVMIVTTTRVDYRGARNSEAPLRRWKARQP
jgi:hypothetical protein